MRITYQPCPVCRVPGMKVEHGAQNERGDFIHIEHCPECGDHNPIIYYECPDCIEALRTTEQLAAHGH